MVLDSTGEPGYGANVKVAGNSSGNHYRFLRGIFSCRFPCGHKKLETRLYRYAFRDCQSRNPVKVILKEDTEELMKW